MSTRTSPGLSNPSSFFASPPLSTSASALSTSPHSSDGSGSPEKSQIPAPTHVDGTGRLQTVTREANPRYHALIAAFRDLTGVPVVLNTSFNDNEPIVCRPGEAIDCFLRTQMDALVLGDFLISRP